jgi:hypothetical protein
VVDNGLISYSVDSPASVSKKGRILLANLLQSSSLDIS